ncbi:RNA ligase RtcB family protein [Pseudemcibacter aquimaris]|uniref:RNA ligase RtcB family protein n=1 Tax=Pseudemcibacter aquimaris TaxID=2857064 RepID=UPI002011B4EA|nr:RNA ligase RtcB family protein [Pseudemcibacter aquimaris]MCC3860619.1 RNA ligase RtcB family protein [Pseudemcibacter aquimaris]WDU59438.1 RNA ligase RtcB family protein [Pseudemcibacter aquimaris]
MCNNCVNIIASCDSWIEGEAIRQLEETAKLKGIKRAVGLPDLHPGKGIPIGASFLSEGVIYPHLVGNDIGCGMGLWTTDIPVHKFKLDKAVKKLKGFEEPYDGDISDILDEEEFYEFTSHSFGTIGGGNHFAEFQRVDQVFDNGLFQSLGLDEKSVALLIHSGSRGLGQVIYHKYVSDCKAEGLRENSGAFDAYITEHDYAIKWAEINRRVIAKRFLNRLGGTGKRCLDICHNSVTNYVDGGWLHRKGAAPSDKGAIVIPGSRGAITYVVMPKSGVDDVALKSLAHGAGRKWKRGEVKDKLVKRYKVADLEQTRFGGRVICEDKALIYEEATEAYKDIEVVISDLVNAGLIDLIASMKPLITYKTRRK